MNQVTLVGRLSRAPKRIRDTHAFPLALFADGQARPTAFAPIVSAHAIPEALVYRDGARLGEQVLVRVTGHVRTRNRTLALREDVRQLLLRSGLRDRRLIRAAVGLIPADLRARHVEVEIVAEDIRVETEVHEHANPAGHVGG